MASSTNSPAEKRTIILKIGATVALVSVAAVFAYRAIPEQDDAGPAQRQYRAKVEHVRSGHKVRLDSGEDLVYAGIRAPFKGEPGYEEAKQRNAQLVEDRRVRLRFEEDERNRDGDLVAYVFAEGVFVNALLVEEGLAYVRLTPDTQRFAEELLTAQSKARRKRTRLWKTALKTATQRLVADPKYGNFHRSDCEEAQKIKKERIVQFQTKYEAFSKGFAPCTKCRP